MNPALRPQEDLFERWFPALLAVLVHAFLVGVLYYGVNWQKKAPEAFEVALVEAEAPRHSVPPPPPPHAERPTLPDKPRPEPVVEPPKPLKPVDIAEPEPKPVKKPKPAPPPPPPKPEEKPKPAKRPAQEIDATAGRESEQARTAALLARDADRARQQAMMREETGRLDAARAKASSSRALDEYVNSIRVKVRGLINVPPGISGNPEAVFLVKQLPTGYVMGEIQLKRSSGNEALDAAIKRAIYLASPLPLPKDPAQFQRELELKIRPLEQ